jgi:hypothetical protein
MAATPISKHGSVNGRSWQRASTRLYRGVFLVTGSSLRSRRTNTSVSSSSAWR